MASGLPEPLQGRNCHAQQVSFFRLDFTHEDKKKSLKIGILPRGSLITSIKVFIKTVFSEAKVKIGTTRGGEEIGEADIKAQGTKEITPKDQKEFVPYDKEVTLYATADKEVASGAATIVVEFVTNR